MRGKVLLMILAAMLLTACGKNGSLPAEPEEVSEDVAVAETMVDWVQYETLAELVIESENIFVGKVKEQLACVERGGYEVEMPFRVAVTRVLKGELAEKDEITVTQPGGMTQDGTCLYRYNGVQFLEEGEDYLLFTSAAKGEYYGLMPPAVGDIRIEDGVLKFRGDQVNLFSAEETDAERAAEEILGMADLPRNPLNRVMTEDVEWIEYEDGSVPAGETAAVYDKSYEIERILRQIRGLEPLDGRPEDYGECEPGGDVDFRIFLGNGEQIDIECCGNNVRCGEEYFRGRIDLPKNNFAARTERVWYWNGNCEDALNGADAEYPVFAIRSYEELQAFLGKYGEGMGVNDAAVWLDGEYLSADEDYFAEMALMIVYAPSSSGHEIGYVDHRKNDGTVVVELERYESGEHVAAEVGWLNCIPVEKDYFADVSNAEVAAEN